jgi:hypothetical protein
MQSAARLKVYRSAEWAWGRGQLTVAVLAYQGAARLALGAREIKLSLPAGDFLLAGGASTGHRGLDGLALIRPTRRRLR